MTSTIDRDTTAAGSQTLRLRLHVLRLPSGWFADIDDENDRQCDDPYWAHSSCSSVKEAIGVGCCQLAQMQTELEAVRRRGRVSQADRNVEDVG
jgi:hypothetical protein